MKNDFLSAKDAKKREVKTLKIIFAPFADKKGFLT